MAFDEWKNVVLNALESNHDKRLSVAIFDRINRERQGEVVDMTSVQQAVQSFSAPNVLFGEIELIYYSCS
jgi:hypothetical protein